MSVGILARKVSLSTVQHYQICIDSELSEATNTQNVFLLPSDFIT